MRNLLNIIKSYFYLAILAPFTINPSPPPARWTQDEINLLITMYVSGNHTIEDMALELGRTPSAVYQKLQRIRNADKLR